MNSVFKPITIKRVSLQYPKLDGLYAWDHSTRKTLPAGPSEPGAAWSVNFRLPKDEADALVEQLKAHYNECKKEDKKMPAFSKVFGMKTLEGGGVEFAVKRRAKTKAGKDNTPPRVVAANLEPLEDKRIYSGSLGSVKVNAFPTTDPNGEGGISILLDAVQVIEPIYGDASDDFEDESEF